ncbi:MAG: LPS-assembly protein LptD [Spirochaetaceae bacterium]|nr:LPS-assembly protein LptD [Spirochaetaceae bacterium]
MAAGKLYAQEATGDTAADSAVAESAATESAVAESAVADSAATDSAGGDGTAEAANDAGSVEQEEPLTAEELAARQEKQEANRVIDLEIKTSTLLELAEWCRELGLSEGGNREELVTRLRSHFEVPLPGDAAAPNQKIVTIETAKTTEYFTVEAVDEEYARLSGGVVLSLKEGDARHRIKAWEIIYNRTRNILSATGGVEYVKEDGDKLETFKGDNISINLDTWIGSFIDTVSERSIAGSETAYRFAGQVISQTDDETTVLKKAHVTNAKTDEPYWSLDAGKLWILPGSDWAMFNATLRVGEIPVLWMPFFFFPSDEMVIHPALGTRTREGTFLQTTTYIFGRPDASAITQNSITQILGSGEGMERVRDGLFLRTTGRKNTETDTKKVSILADAYTGLGFYVGTEISLPKLGPVNNFALSGGFAFTRTIFEPGTGAKYTPYNVAVDNAEHWDSSYLFGVELPFRFRMKTAPSFSGKYGTLSLNFPVYSDPFVDHDVLNRSESIDWMEMLIQGAATPDTPDSNVAGLGAYEWNITVKPQFSTTALSPYISSLSINSISSVYHFAVKTNNKSIPEAVRPTSPQREFYYPDKFTLYSISGSVSGTPLTWTSITSVTEKDKEAPDPVKGFGTIRSPWENETAAADSQADSASGVKPFSLDIPALNQTFDMGRGTGLKISWNYNLTPTSASELNYSTTDWSSHEDIELSDIKSILTRVSTTGNTNINISDPNNNMFSLSGGITGRAQWQDHPYMDLEAAEYDTQDKIDTEKYSDYQNTSWSTSWVHSTTINPLYWTPAWKSTNIKYSLEGKLAESKLVSSRGSDPEWDVVYGGWDKEKISRHNLAMNMGVSILDRMQTLQLNTDLPPLTSKFGMNSTINAWISTTNIRTEINEPFSDEVKYLPVYFTETLTFKTGYKLDQVITYSPEYSDLTTYNSTLTLGKFSAAYASSRGKKRILTKDTGGNVTGWATDQNSEEKLRPVSLNFSFIPSFKKDNLLNKTLSFSLDPSMKLGLDLLNYTESYLEFSLNLTLNITKFLSLSMGTNSRNVQMYWYLKDLPLFDEYSSDIPQSPSINDNFFEDLINSFRFDNEELRRNSGFKLKSFNFSTTHHLGDWDAKLTVSMSPWRPSGENYQFDTQVSFVIQWLPISELKTEVAYDGKNDIFLSK